MPSFRTARSDDPDRVGQRLKQTCALRMTRRVSHKVASNLVRRRQMRSSGASAHSCKITHDLPRSPPEQVRGRRFGPSASPMFASASSRSPGSPSESPGMTNCILDQHCLNNHMEIYKLMIIKEKLIYKSPIVTGRLFAMLRSEEHT